MNKISELFSLENKTILINGASSGIGKATAILCSQLGANLILTGRSEEKLFEVEKLLTPNNHKFIVLDFENDNTVEQLMQFISGKIDGIVHSIGILYNLPIIYTNENKLNRILRTNFEIPYIITQQLLKNKKVNRAASIVFVSSISGVSTVTSGISAYSASKGAISAVVRVMALELANKAIRVNAICPGMVITEMNLMNENVTDEQLKEDELKNYPLGYGQPEDVAASILFLLGNGSKWITGSNLIIDGGFSIH
jgi:NAD(P)-dependent dehydrogenase (short-subunit alcohol dehydrogenase family)